MVKFKNESSIENVEHGNSNIRGKRSKITNFYYSDCDKVPKSCIIEGILKKLIKNKEKHENCSK